MLTRALRLIVLPLFHGLCFIRSESEHQRFISTPSGALYARHQLEQQQKQTGTENNNNRNSSDYCDPQAAANESVSLESRLLGTDSTATTSQLVGTDSPTFLLIDPLDGSVIACGGTTTDSWCFLLVDYFSTHPLMLKHTERLNSGNALNWTIYAEALLSSAMRESRITAVHEAPVPTHVLAIRNAIMCRVCIFLCIVFLCMIFV